MTRLARAAALVLVGAMSAGPATAARAPVVGVTLTASPRWGRSTPAAWTPYLVSVRNDSLRDIEGQVVLLPVRTPPPSLENDAEGASATAPEITDQQVPNVLALGETELTVPRERLPVRTAADFPAYRAQVSLAAGGVQKTLTIPVLEAPHGYRAELRDRAGEVLASSQAKDQRSAAKDRGTVLLMSQAPGAEANLAGLGELLGEEREALSVVSSARDFPASALLLSGLDCIVLDRFDVSGLSAVQLRALQDFVAFGGSLVVAGGADGVRDSSALPEVLLPLRPTSTGVASLLPLANLVARTTQASAAVTTGDIRRGRSALQAPGGPPLVVEAEYGAGRVVQLAYDPLDETLAADPLLRDLGWYQAISRGLHRAGADDGVTGVAPPEQLWSPVLAPTGWPRWPRASLWSLGAYAVVVLPLGYGLLRRRRRAQLVWLYVPLVVLVLAGSVVLAGGRRTVGELPTVEVRTLGPTDEVLVNSYRGIASNPGRTQASGPPGAALVSTTFVGPVPLSRPMGGDLVHGGRGSGIIDIGPSSPRVSLQAGGIEARNLQVVSLEHQVGLESDLRLTGTARPDMGGLRIRGTLKNRLPSPVHGLRAQLPEGALARVAETLQTGQTLQVDAPFVWPRSIPAGSGIPADPNERILFAAASEAFSDGGQVVVAGLLAETAGRISVMVQPVPLDRSEIPIARSGKARLVASIPEPTGTRVSVYDFESLPGDAPLELKYGRNAQPTEVYDWTSGSWRPVPLTNPRDPSGSVALSENETHEGIVRIRTKGDPRFFDYSI